MVASRMLNRFHECTPESTVQQLLFDGDARWERWQRQYVCRWKLRRKRLCVNTWIISGVCDFECTPRHNPRYNSYRMQADSPRHSKSKSSERSNQTRAHTHTKQTADKQKLLSHVCVTNSCRRCYTSPQHGLHFKAMRATAAAVLSPLSKVLEVCDFSLQMACNTEGNPHMMGTLKKIETVTCYIRCERREQWWVVMAPEKGMFSFRAKHLRASQPEGSETDFIMILWAFSSTGK